MASSRHRNLQMYLSNGTKNSSRSPLSKTSTYRSKTMLASIVYHRRSHRVARAPIVRTHLEHVASRRLNKVRIWPVKSSLLRKYWNPSHLESQDRNNAFAFVSEKYLKSKNEYIGTSESYHLVFKDTGNGNSNSNSKRKINGGFSPAARMAASIIVHVRKAKPHITYTALDHWPFSLGWPVLPWSF